MQALRKTRAGATQVVISGFDDAARFDALRRMGFEALVDVAGRPLAEATRLHTGAACRQRSAVQLRRARRARRAGRCGGSEEAVRRLV